MGLVFPVRLQTAETFLVALHGRRRFLTTREEDVIDKWAAIIVTDIENAWPVDTGLSAGSWEWVVFDTLEAGFGFRIINDVPYVQFIHRAGAPPEPPLWETLLPAVVRAHGPGLLGELMEVIRQEESRNQPFFGPGAATPRRTA